MFVRIFVVQQAQAVLRNAGKRLYAKATFVEPTLRKAASTLSASGGQRVRTTRQDLRSRKSGTKFKIFRKRAEVKQKKR